MQPKIAVQYPPDIGFESFRALVDSGRPVYYGFYNCLPDPCRSEHFSLPASVARGLHEEHALDFEVPSEIDLRIRQEMEKADPAVDFESFAIHRADFDRQRMSVVYVWMIGGIVCASRTTKKVLPPGKLAD